MEGVQLYHDQALVLKDRSFHCKVLSRQQINVLANFCQLRKKFRVSRGLVKDVHRFGQFSHRHFKF